MTKKKASKVEAPLLIIGNGMVSWRFCQQLVKLGVHEKTTIVVYGEESLPAYDRVNLTKHFEWKDAQKLLLAASGWYQEHGIELRTANKIARLDPKQSMAVDADGNEVPYSRCVLATGSLPTMPKIPGTDLPGVYTYRTTQDVERIQEAAKTAKRAVVIGGGLLGLEIADVLNRSQVETSIIQSANTVLSRQLTEDGGGYLLKELAKRHLQIRLKTRTEAIKENGSKLNLNFHDGETADADMVVIAIGVTPRDELAQDAGLKTAVHGGVIVNDRLESSDNQIYAIGECASHHGKAYGLVAPCYEMADVLAYRLAGQKRYYYRGSDESCRLKLLGFEVSVFGDFMQEGEYYTYRGENEYRNLVVKRGRLIGATVIGSWEQTAEIERAVRAMNKFSVRHLNDFRGSGDLQGISKESSPLDWPEEAILCNCTRTSCGVLRTAACEGCDSVGALTSKTGAGSVCGSCLPQIACFVGESADSFKDVASQKGGLILQIAACIAIILIVTGIAMPPMPVAETVQSAYYRFSTIWQETVTKQITGYTIAGLSAIALLLSARKRFKWLNFGNFGFWRAAHSWLGLATLGGIFMHTGLNFGENLNLWLLICFLGMNLAGGLAALALATEKKLSGPLGRKLRDYATKLHIIFFLPYPILLGFHIAKVYMW
ncbi:MAG: FAD-dependent oxidoreductase [Verrucomicrobiota bacterium]